MAQLRDAQRDVEMFMRSIGQTPPGPLDGPHMPDEATRRLRATLIAEEVAETIAALGFDVDIYVTDRFDDGSDAWRNDVNKKADLDLAEVADGIADSIVVELGTAVACGIDMEPVWDEVTKTNATKASGPVRPDGKRLKPEGWVPPRIESILNQQIGERRQRRLGVA